MHERLGDGDRDSEPESANAPGVAATQAIAAFDRWNAGFNTRDVEAMLAEMHFPHVRLGSVGFQVWETGEDFRRAQAPLTRALEREGWHTTTTASIEAVQADSNKVHLAIHQSRRDTRDVEYNGFDTLWIFTRIDGRWGAQLRSSFLASPAQGMSAGAEIAGTRLDR